MIRPVRYRSSVSTRSGIGTPERGEEVTLEAGIGDVRLDFSGLQREETRIRAEIGLGNLEIRIPSEAEIRLTRESFLTSLEAPG